MICPLDQQPCTGDHSHRCFTSCERSDPAPLGQHPLAVDLCEFIDDQPVELRQLLAHVVTCRACHKSVVNIIQSSPGYPDLFGRQT